MSMAHFDHIVMDVVYYKTVRGCAACVFGGYHIFVMIIISFFCRSSVVGVMTGEQMWLKLKGYKKLELISLKMR